MKQLAATRVPPGDRWMLENDDTIHTTLTDALNAIFMETSATEFVVDAKDGKVYTEDGVIAPKPVKNYSLYGDEY